jgi:hypothetical protein
VKSAGRIQPQFKQRRIADSMERNFIMKDVTQRVINPWIHIICAIPITVYIYIPFSVIPDYAPMTRFVFFPVMVLSGLWMWKGPLVRRLVSRSA